MRIENWYLSCNARHVRSKTGPLSQEDDKRGFWRVKIAKKGAQLRCRNKFKPWISSRKSVKITVDWEWLGQRLRVEDQWQEGRKKEPGEGKGNNIIYQSWSGEAVKGVAETIPFGLVYRRGWGSGTCIMHPSGRICSRSRLRRCTQVGVGTTSGVVYRWSRRCGHVCVHVRL